MEPERKAESQRRTEPETEARAKPSATARIPELPACRLGSLICEFSELIVTPRFSDHFLNRPHLRDKYGEYVIDLSDILRRLPEGELRLQYSLRQYGNIESGIEAHVRYLQQVPPTKWPAPFRAAMAEMERTGRFGTIWHEGRSYRWPIDEQERSERSIAAIIDALLKRHGRP